VLHGVKAGTFGEHPPGEDALDLARELGLVDLDEGGGVRRLGRRRRIANPRRYLERAELDGLIDRNLEMGDAPGHLVERSEHGDRVLDRVGKDRGRQDNRRCQASGNQGKRGAGLKPRRIVNASHHSAHLPNGGVLASSRCAPGFEHDFRKILVPYFRPSCQLRMARP
jgi:hypothetical protein